MLKKLFSIHQGRRQHLHFLYCELCLYWVITSRIQKNSTTPIWNSWFLFPLHVPTSLGNRALPQAGCWLLVQGVCSWALSICSWHGPSCSLHSRCALWPSYSAFPVPWGFQYGHILVMWLEFFRKIFFELGNYSKVGCSRLMPAERANCVPLFPTPCSVISHCSLEINHGMSVYSREISKHYKSGIFLSFFSL